MKLFIHVNNGVILAFLLASCSQNRPETAEYFQSKTGINLCKSAQIKNEKVSEYDNETDFTYKVQINFNKKCRLTFFKDLNRLKLQNCIPDTDCDFFDKIMWYYKIDIKDYGVDFTIMAS